MNDLSASGHDTLSPAVLRANGARLLDSLHAMARIGATPAGGVCRLALSETDRLGRDCFADWCRTAGMSVSTDEIGNLYARRAARNAALPPVLVGSHLDSQPQGGRFDGVFGVLAALEVVRSLNDLHIETERAIEIVSWTNEEGARFSPAMMGSAVFTGDMSLSDALAACDRDGVSVAAALDAIGARGTRRAAAQPIDAYFEAHIEQGPILEAEALQIGVVSGGQAIRWFDIEVTGVAAHAGTTPVAMRRDALFACATLIARIEAALGRRQPQALATIGEIGVSHGSYNTIPASVRFTLDLRHPDDAAIADFEAEVRTLCEALARERGVRVAIEPVWVSPATPFDPACVELVEAATRELGYSHRRMVSGAGHDAIQIARHHPTAMVFIPCVGGLSHNEAEDVLPDDACRGVDVLLNAVARRAMRPA